MHTRAKISATFWLVASALITLLALAINLRWYYTLEVYQLTAVGLLLIVVWRLWAVRRLQKKQEQDAQRRLAELQYEVSVLRKPVRIEGMGSTLWLVLGIVVTALFFMMYLGTGKIEALGFAACAMIGVLIAALIRIAKRGQPLLIISREGLQPAGYGLLPWHAIRRVECRTAERKHVSGTALHLHVPGSQAHLHSAHPIMRFFRGIPGIRAADYVDVITIPLRKPSELPSVIEQLCRNISRETARGEKTPEQMRAEMEDLKRQAQFVRDHNFRRESWERVWTVPGGLALALLIGQVPFGRLVAFVPKESWSTQALVIAAVLGTLAWGFVIGHARDVFGAAFTRTRLIQVLVILGLGSALVLPMTWFLITDVGGAMAAYDAGRGPNEQITVIATKEERSTRRSCNYILTHPGLGKRMCLVRAQFLAYPNQVPVVLSIRRNALGYKVYEQKIATSIP